MSSASTPDFDHLGFTALLDHVDLTIIESEKRTNPMVNLKEFFVVYLIETKVRNPKILEILLIPQVNMVWRRYSEFEQLQLHLQSQYPYLIVPPIPEKKQTYTWRNDISYDTLDPDFIDRRRAGLENFLHRVAMHPILSRDQTLREFLTNNNGWNTCLKQPGYIYIFETKFKVFTLPNKQIQIVDKFDKILAYSRNLEVSIDAILKSKAKTTEKLFIIDNLHAHCGRLFSEWSVIEKKMGDGLQKAGHFIDTIPSSTEIILQDEDVISDQFKEYLFYTSSLEEMCKHRAALNAHIAMLKETTASLVEEKCGIRQGKSKFVARLFGALQTRELRDEKIQQLENQIEDEEVKLKESERILGEFNTLASNDFDRFERQKNLDIQQSLSSYVSQQVQIARKGLSTWLNIRNCIEGIP